MRIHAERFIDAPIEEVFAFFTDIRRRPEYFNEIEQETLPEDADLGVGMTWKEEHRTHGGPITTTLTVKAFIPQTAFTLQSIGDGIICVYRYQFEAEHNGTRVKMSSDVKGRWLLPKLMTMALSVLTWLVPRDALKGPQEHLDTIAQGFEQQ